MYYAEEYSPPRIPQLKSLAIIEQDELMTLKQKKLELELKLKQKELEIKQNQRQDQNDDQENTILKVQQQPQDSKKGKGGQKIKQTGQQQQSGSTLAQMKEAERVENEKKEMISKIAFLEKEKKALQNQFDQLKESIRADNVQLKEQAIKSKSEANTLQKQKDDIENDKNAIAKENRKVKQEMKIWQDKYNDLIKSVADAEAKIKANKDVVNEREEKIKWIEDRLKKEEEQHKKTQERCMILVNEINQLKRDCDGFRKDKERLLDEMQQINQKHTLKYSDLNEQVLLYQRELNEQKLGQSEFKRLLEQKSNRIKDLEFERERLLVRVQDLDRLEHKLGARDREIIELEVELDRVKRMRGTHIVEKIVHPIGYEIPREVPVYPPQQDNDVVKLREDLLYLKQEKERALDEAEYWKNRYQDLELAEDRAINLMAHQNKNEADHNVQLQETKSIMFTKVMGLINDLSKLRRTSMSNDVKEAIEQVLNNHNDILKYIMSQ
ncbi:unnamed protein product [Paramecium sonneborni]|uniref:Uncharacterized protein n=1 Tax=Paramecium sonneborni TaxID=65129 RepID=A0A8S1MFS4_9CILI|nr:unnamed protein product [Paramecium sonneborni]